jgi:hypothetical protein
MITGCNSIKPCRRPDKRYLITIKAGDNGTFKPLSKCLGFIKNFGERRWGQKYYDEMISGGRSVIEKEDIFGRMGVKPKTQKRRKK